MAIVVVGGHSRKVGKTSATAALIAATPQCRWTAIKISHHLHNGLVRDSVMTEESAFLYKLARLLRCSWIAPKPMNDTSRFLSAGASRAVLISVHEDDSATLMEYLSPIIQASPFTVIESNRIMRLLEPDLCLVVLKTDVEEFKESALKMLARADALLIVDCGGPPPAWRESLGPALERIAQFTTRDPEQIPQGLIDLVKARIGITQGARESSRTLLSP